MVEASRAHAEPGADTTLISRRFTAADIPVLRTTITEIAARSGLDADQVTDWVAAVNELLINVARHGGGDGHLNLWLGPPLTCEVRDGGPGFDATRYLDRADRPPLSASGGMGLWLARHLTERLSIHSGPGGTTVRVTAKGGG